MAMNRTSLRHYRPQLVVRPSCSCSGHSLPPLGPARTVPRELPPSSGGMRSGRCPFRSRAVVEGGGGKGHPGQPGRLPVCVSSGLVYNSPQESRATERNTLRYLAALGWKGGPFPAPSRSHRGPVGTFFSSNFIILYSAVLGHGSLNIHSLS